MSFTYNDYVEANQRLSKEKLQHDPGLPLLKQAAVSVDTLTNDDKWDHFLSLLQEWIENTETQRDNLREMSLSASVVDPNEQLRIKNYYLQASERCDVLNAVIKLPKQIINECERIELALAEIPDV